MLHLHPRRMALSSLLCEYGSLFTHDVRWISSLLCEYGSLCTHDVRRKFYSIVYLQTNVIHGGNGVQGFIDKVIKLQRWDTKEKTNSTLLQAKVWVHLHLRRTAKVKRENYNSIFWSNNFTVGVQCSQIQLLLLKINFVWVWCWFPRQRNFFFFVVNWPQVEFSFS